MECPEHRAEERALVSGVRFGEGFGTYRDETPGREVGHDLDVVDVAARVVRAGTPGDDGVARGVVAVERGGVDGDDGAKAVEEVAAEAGGDGGGGDARGVGTEARVPTGNVRGSVRRGLAERNADGVRSARSGLAAGRERAVAVSAERREGARGGENRSGRARKRRRNSLTRGGGVPGRRGGGGGEGGGQRARRHRRHERSGIRAAGGHDVRAWTLWRSPCGRGESRGFVSAGATYRELG